MAKVLKRSFYLEDRYIKLQHQIEKMKANAPYEYGVRWPLLLVPIFMLFVPELRYIGFFALFLSVPFLAYRKSTRVVPDFSYLYRKNSTWLQGYYGERDVFRALLTLPDEFYIANDIYVSGHQIDHVVISPKGVIAIQTKNFMGSYRYIDSKHWSTMKGLWIKNPQKQAEDGAGALAKFLGVKVRPVVVMSSPITLYGPPPEKTVPMFLIPSFLRWVVALPDVMGQAQVLALNAKLTPCFERPPNKAPCP